MKKLLGIALAIFGVGAMVSSALGAPKPIRHLVYNLGVSIRQQTDVHTSGGTAAGDDNVRGSAGGSQTQHASVSTLSRGSISVDIVGMDRDRSLVADISESTDTRKAPVVRAIVYPNGVVEVGVSDAENVTEEERLLLHFLARDLVTPSAVAQGNWHSSQIIPQGTQSESFHVVSTARDGTLRLEVDRNVVVRDAHPFDMVTHGTLLYDEAKSTPKMVALSSRTHHEGLQQTDTIDQNVDLDLVTDSPGV
ncbi:MAG: hypothetical protein NVS1B14_07930 [Vulcanimicrobiaceae bacterium]